MKGIDPIWLTVISTIVAIDNWIGGGNASLTHVFPSSWIPWIIGWCGFLGGLLGFVVAALTTLISAKPGILIKPPVVAKVAVVAWLPLPLIALALLAAPVRAASLTQPAPGVATVPQFLPAQAPCVINNCTGWYAGAGITGNGTNADIIGSGLSNSVFAAGGALDLHGGYQYWDGRWFAAIEAGLGYQFQSRPITINSNNLTGYEIVKVGASLSGLAGTGASAITIPTALSNVLMSPYFAFGGIQRNGYSQWATGAGAEFLLATNWGLDMRYLYAPAIDNLGADNQVTIGLNYHF